MDPKKIFIVSFMALVIACSTVWTSSPPKAAADAYGYATTDDTAQKDDFLRLLGAESEDAVYAKLYTGGTLAELAAENNTDIQQVIQLQIAEMKQQLDDRLMKGSISIPAYVAQVAELPEIITNSVLGIH